MLVHVLELAHPPPKARDDPAPNVSSSELVKARWKVIGPSVGLPEGWAWDSIKESVDIQAAGFFLALPWPHLNEAFRLSQWGACKGCNPHPGLAWR